MVALQHRPLIPEDPLERRTLLNKMLLVEGARTGRDVAGAIVYAAARNGRGKCLVRKGFAKRSVSARARVRPH